MDRKAKEENVNHALFLEEVRKESLTTHGKRGKVNF
jgi:hypothetical protein